MMTWAFFIFLSYHEVPYILEYATTIVKVIHFMNDEACFKKSKISNSVNGADGNRGQVITHSTSPKITPALRMAISSGFYDHIASMNFLGLLYY